MSNEERLCEMTVEIGGHEKEREGEIIRACMVEWSFRRDDFYRRPADAGTAELLCASALGTLYAGESEEEVVQRLERAVWRENGSMCHVDVEAICRDSRVARVRRHACVGA